MDGEREKVQSGGKVNVEGGGGLEEWQEKVSVGWGRS